MSKTLGEYIPGKEYAEGEVHTTGITPPTPPARAGQGGKIALALFPLSGIPLTGPNAVYAWGRLALYGSLTYSTWKRARKLSYVFAGATGASLLSSISTKAWEGSSNAGS